VTILGTKQQSLSNRKKLAQGQPFKLSFALTGRFAMCTNVHHRLVLAAGIPAIHSRGVLHSHHQAPKRKQNHITTTTAEDIKPIGILFHDHKESKNNEKRIFWVLVKPHVCHFKLFKFKLEGHASLRSQGCCWGIHL